MRDGASDEDGDGNGDGASDGEASLILYPAL